MPIDFDDMCSYLEIGRDAASTCENLEMLHMSSDCEECKSTMSCNLTDMEILNYILNQANRGSVDSGNGGSPPGSAELSAQFENTSLATVKNLASYFPDDIAREANNDHQEMPYLQHDDDTDREHGNTIACKINICEVNYSTSFVPNENHSLKAAATFEPIITTGVYVASDIDMQQDDDQELQSQEKDTNQSLSCDTTLQLALSCNGSNEQDNESGYMSESAMKTL